MNAREFLRGRTTTQRAGSSITGQAARLSRREQRRREKRRPWVTLSYRGELAGLIRAAKYFATKT